MYLPTPRKCVQAFKDGLGFCIASSSDLRRCGAGAKAPGGIYGK